MPSVLSVPVSEELLARLQRRAAEQGITPEAVAAADLEREAPKSETDPLLKWAGAFASDVPDAAERHHEYLGQALYDEMTGREETSDVR